MTRGENEKLLMVTLVAGTGAPKLGDGAAAGMDIGAGADAWLTAVPVQAASVMVDAAASEASAAT
jgi:microcompartment protein CcmK/EutM